MKYFVKQKIFSIGEKYEIYDENSVVKYRVEGAVFSLGEKFKLYDENGNMLYQVNQENKNVELVLAVILMIDEVIDSSNND